MPNCKVTAKSLSAWFATQQGEYVLAREQAYFDRSVSDIFGYNAVQLGLVEHDFLRTSRIALHLTGDGVVGANVRLCNEELPFASGSLDMLLMPHLLEFAEHPHQILREAERVLMPEGSLLISGFNPFSLWGLHRALGRKEGYPWCGNFVALYRLKDWLALLGLEVVGGHFAAYAPPFQQAKWLARGACLEAAGARWWKGGGGLYFLHAIKRVHGVHPIKPQWDKRLVQKLLPVAPKLNGKMTQRNNTDEQ